MKISFIFAWYDLWIGLYYDRKNRNLYILPVPFIGIVLKFKQKSKCPHIGRYEIYADYGKRYWLEECLQCGEIIKTENP